MDDETERQAQQNRVIELTDAWQEIGHQIDRQGEITEDKEEDRSPRPGNASVAGQSTDEDDAVGNEARQRTGVLTPAGGDQGGDGDCIQTQRNED